MVHLIKKRTVFQKGNYKINYDKINLSGCLHGYYFPSKLYMQFQLPYYYPSKTTVFQKKYYDFMNKKSILNWF